MVEVALVGEGPQVGQPVEELLDRHGEDRVGGEDINGATVGNRWFGWLECLRAPNGRLHTDKRIF